MSAKNVSASGVEAPLDFTSSRTDSIASTLVKLYTRFTSIASTLAKLYSWLTSIAYTLVKIYTESSKEEKVYIYFMAIGTLPFIWHLIWTLLEACISSVDCTGRLFTTVFAVLGSPFLLWTTLDTDFPAKIRLMSYVANHCNGLIVTLELLRGYFFTLLCLWEMATSGPARVFGFVLAIIFFVCFLMTGGLFWSFVKGYGFDGADCGLESILEDEIEEKRKEEKKKREEKERIEEKTKYNKGVDGGEGGGG